MFDGFFFHPPALAYAFALSFVFGVNAVKRNVNVCFINSSIFFLFPGRIALPKGSMFVLLGKENYNSMLDKRGIRNRNVCNV